MKNSSIFVLMTTFIMMVLITSSTDAQSLYDCDVENCLNVFNSSQVTIESIQALSSYAYFQNPLLEADITLLRGNPDGVELYMEAPQILFPNELEHCDLLLVGLADADGNLQERITIPAGETEARIELFSFCQTLNLPGVQGGALPFPNQGTLINPENIEPIIERQDELIALVERARSETCVGGTWVNAPENASEENTFALGLDALATQFAVFILFTDPVDRETIWQDFLLDANNSIYQRDFEGIYDCLLEPVSIEPPPSTPTPLPTATPTPIVALAPTSTPVPIWEQDLIDVPVTGQQVSFVRFFSFAGASVVAIIISAVGLASLAITIQRFRRAVVVLIILLLLLLLGYAILIESNILPFFSGGAL